jgi:hypothetical protein
MRSLVGLAALLAALTAPASAGEAAFAAKPSAAKDGEKVKIAFAVSAPTDVEVCVLDAQGKEVRHLAAGVLGGRQAPPAPLAPGLAQALEWDGRDDFGKPAAGGPFRIRVRAGTSVKFSRFLGGDDPYMLGLVSSMTADADGRLYVLGGREEDSLTCMTLRAFSPDGRYLRTIMPFPADLAPGDMKDVAAWDETGGCFRPKNYRATNVCFYTLLGGNGSGMTPSVVLELLAVSKKRGVLLTDGSQLMALDERGAVRGASFKSRALWAPENRARNWGPFYAALSPDERYLYISGPRTAKNSGYEYKPGCPPGRVYRLDLDADGPAEPFATIPVEHTDGNGGAWTKDNGAYSSYGTAGAPKGPVHGVASDSQGRVYVCDRERGRVAVFGQDGRELGGLTVRWPDRVCVHPRSGAIYVFEKVSFGRAAIPFAARLLKFDAFKEGAKPSAVLELPSVADRTALAASFPGDRALFWIRTGFSRYGKYTLQTVEDKGARFEPVETGYRPGKESQWGWHRLAADWERDEVYGSDGTVGMWRYDGRTGQGTFLTRDGRQFWSQDLAVGCDGLLYVRQGGGAPEFQDYSGPLARFTRELQPAPFEGSGSNVLSKYIYSREGPGYAERGLGVGPDGRVYISWQFLGFASYAVTGFAPDGKPLKGRYCAGKGHEGNYKSGTPKELDSAIIGPVPGSNGGLRVDLAGDVYLGLWNWPKDVPAPEKWAKDVAYMCTTGSVFKFSPEGGAVLAPGKGQKLEDVRPAGAKGMVARTGSREGAGLFGDAFVEGAVAAYPGFGPFSAPHFGSNTCCACRTPRFDLDRYGRLYLPNAMTNSVRVVDNAGNEILEFGRYGNYDSLLVNPNLEAGKAGKPTVAVPDIPLGWPTAAGVTREAIYVCDSYNRRGVRVVPVYAAEETCTVGP